MKLLKYKIILMMFLVVSGCITQFVPETDEDQDLVVVEGLITDQPEVYKVKLSSSMPLGRKPVLKPLKECTVYIIDDHGNTYLLNESATAGTYISDPSSFRGVVGREYTLYVNTNNSTSAHYSYQSLPMEMKSVPPIDTVFYEKVTIKEKDQYSGPWEGAQVYLNTFDSQGKCKYYRWEYTETWKFQLPYYVTNSTCWITNNSSGIHIKNTSVLTEDRVNRYPLKFISNETDRLAVRYSLLVNQYSVNEDEFTYWEKLQNISEEVGSLYDITPASIPGNIFCVEDPGEQVLGYFSVSAKTSKRIYIDPGFRGLVNLYRECPIDTLGFNELVPPWYWVIVEDPFLGYKVVTDKEFCANCTTRGTTTKPDFWEDY